MEGPRRRLFAAVILWLVIVGLSGLSVIALGAGKPAAKPISLKGKKILLVHSYHPGYPWVASISEGVRRALRGTGVQLDILYMDTKRKTSDAWMHEAGQMAAGKMASYKPNVVITCDDNAQQYFVRKYVGGRTPFVFTGVDADPSKYGFPASNVTGIIERPQLRASLELARRLRPIKRIAVLSCNDSTSIAALGFMKQDPIDAKVVEWKLAKDYNDWKQAVLRYNKTVDAIVVRSYQAVVDPSTGGKMNPATVALWTAHNAKVPTIAFHDFEIKDGMLVGVVKSGIEYGEKPTSYALKIMRGTPVRDLPIIRANIGTKMINRSTAQRLGIKLTSRTLQGVQAL